MSDEALPHPDTPLPPPDTPLPTEEKPERKTFVSIEVEAGIDEDWQEAGLDSPPENAEALLAQVKSESSDSIHEFIRDWDLLTFVNVTLQVTHIEPDGKRSTTMATWSSP